MAVAALIGRLGWAAANIRAKWASTVIFGGVPSELDE